jgi:hypothetical protein
MIETLKHTLLISVIESFIWLWFHFGLKKMGVLEKIDSITHSKNWPSWCDYCFSFWISMIIHATIPQIRIYFIAPFITSVMVNLTLKFHYGRN